MDIKALNNYEVIATYKGQVTWHAYQEAIGDRQAVAAQQMYYIPAGVRYDSIRATIRATSATSATSASQE